MNTPLRCALGLLLGLAAPVFAAPPGDRLERPSREAADARQEPLTDVQRIGDRLVMVGANGHILLRHADGKVQQAQVPVDLLLTAVHFVDEHNGWAVGHDGVILHSGDGGQSWIKQLDGVAINALMLKWAEAEVARLEAASDADDEALDNALFALDDARAGAASGPSRPLLDVWFRNAREGWAVGAYGMIVHTADGGQSWEYLSSLDNPERLHLNAVLGLADGSLLVAGEGGRLYRSSDGGRTWQPAQQPTQASLYKLLQLADGRLLALGFGDTLLSSQDQGQNWQSVALPVRAGLYGGEQLADGSLLLAGQGGVLLASRDGRNFTPWQGKGRSALLGVAAIDAGQLALIGSAGLQVMPLAGIGEQRQ
ncbi:WD40/YVTN/BNR-like repeat-containing protein [Pseudomonas schmalbachii]|uniref:Photosynthesis system II assembly factor Ycf48/Hcf136-like domain-containing protein n=1 Tax=Pseudomonas schmalbachii TaxID=2816993 RepID=A0ABS3TJV3_9PSED|nr:YCF48-related protein [Pseudomonas schmalbachii]MBO3273931.1 hypothetical protein [Pseudomonas schmalbachii]